MIFSETKKQKKAKKIIKMDNDKNDLLSILDFYADEKNYNLIIDKTPTNLISAIEKDKGKKARKIIERIRK